MNGTTFDKNDDPINGLPKAECERLARRYWEFAGRVENARDVYELKMLLANYFMGRAEQLRDEFLEANLHKPPEAT